MSTVDNSDIVKVIIYLVFWCSVTWIKLSFFSNGKPYISFEIRTVYFSTIGTISTYTRLNWSLQNLSSMLSENRNDFNPPYNTYIIIWHYSIFMCWLRIFMYCCSNYLCSRYYVSRVEGKSKFKSIICSIFLNGSTYI